MCATKRPEKAGSAWTSIHNELDKNENIGGFLGKSLFVAPSRLCYNIAITATSLGKG
jgi:hypothetical protein